jgi:hypothetical protein
LYQSCRHQPSARRGCWKLYIGAGLVIRAGDFSPWVRFPARQNCYRATAAAAAPTRFTVPAALTRRPTPDVPSNMKVMRRKLTSDKDL